MYNQGSPLFENVEPPLSDFTIIRAVRQMLEHTSLHDDIVVSLERYLRTLEERTVQAEGRQAMDQAVQQGAQQQQQIQNPIEQQTPDKNLQFNRLSERIRSFLDQINDKVGVNDVADPLIILDALHLYLTTIEGLVSGGGAPTSPGEQEALKALLSYYELIFKRYNNIIVGSSIDDRTMNSLFLGGDVRGITELAQQLANYIEEYVSVGLRGTLFGRSGSLLSFIVRQVGNIKRAFNNGDTYTVVRSKRMGDQAKPLP
jgi:hypothetical protein